MRVLLLHNPGAGQGGHSRAGLTRLFAAEGHEVIYRQVKEDGIHPADAEGVDVVAVGGGDGTIGAAVRALPDADRPFIILPLGTANNVARCLGLPARAEDIIRGCAAAPERRIDLGLATGPWGTQLFLEGAGLGALAEMALVGHRVDASREGKRRFGEEAPHRFVREAPPEEWHIRADGRDVPGALLFAEILNMPLVGPGLPIGPPGLPDDGLLHLVLLRPDGREAFARWAEGGRERPAAGLETLAAGRVTLTWTGGALRIDDRFPDVPAGPAEVALKIAPRKLRVLVPQQEGETR